jgi:hypothetical protein
VENNVILLNPSSIPLKKHIYIESYKKSELNSNLTRLENHNGKRLIFWKVYLPKKYWHF